MSNDILGFGNLFLYSLSEEYEDALRFFLKKWPHKSEKDFIEAATPILKTSLSKYQNERSNRIKEFKSIHPDLEKRVLDYNLKLINDSYRIPIGSLERGLHTLQIRASRLTPQLVQSSEPANTKAKDKIRWLIELGVIDDLHKKEPFNMSINALAEVISKAIGESQTTVQPYLNSYISNNYDKNDPRTHSANGKDPCQPMRDRLRELGFKRK